MKKLSLILLMGVMLIGLTACSSNVTKDGEEQTDAIQNLKEFPEFESTDLEDKKITSDIFKNNNLTLVNIWATFCGPCIDELPYLQELNDEYKDKNIEVIGLLSDGEDSVIDAIKITKKLNITFKSILPDDELNRVIISKLDAVPVSVLIDSNGKVVGKLIFGSRTKDEYKKIIEDGLQELK